MGAAGLASRARPDWRRGGVVIAPALVAAWRAEGRRGLARLLFEVQVVPGEWWADGLGGTLLARATAQGYDWDRRRRADETLEGSGEIQGLVDAAEPDVRDLLRKLGGLANLEGDPAAAFLGTPLRVGERRDLLFPIFGDELRVMPDELGELEPVILEHAPQLLGQRRAARARLVRPQQSPVDVIATELERLPSDAAALGAREHVVARVQRLVELASRTALESWLTGCEQVRPVAGPTQRHFDALAEIAEGLHGQPAPILVLSTAFLNAENAAKPAGLADALAAAPGQTRVLVIYGHASDDLPAQQRRDMEEWLNKLVQKNASLRGRLLLVAGRHRSHEKVLLSSRADWMVGSWNAGSSLPGATVFECSLLGQSPRFAAELLQIIAENIEGDEARGLIDALSRALASAASPPSEAPERMVARLREALGVLVAAIPAADGARAEAWCPAVLAARAALQPIRRAVKLQIIDQHQTRDAFAGLVASARASVLVTSDRLADSALDPATLRDLRGDGRSRRLLRVVWGREWAGRRPGDRATREQLQRARRTLRDARERLGDQLLTRDEPMENHAKVMVVDGLRGAVTSENLLSYGGEKGRRESRELGLLFWSPVLGRDLLGRVLQRWPDLETPPLGTAGPPLGWAVATSELWYGLSGIAGELDFDWSTPAYLSAALREEVGSVAEEDAPRRLAWEALTRRAGPAPVAWVRQEAERLGLAQVDAAGRWRPWDAPPDTDPDALLAEARRVLAALPPEVVIEVAPRAPDGPAVHPLVARVLAELVPISAGSFLMGDDRVPEERPRHRVHLTRPFLLGRTPVTQGLWYAVMGRLPHLRDVERHPEFPIIQVSYAEMMAFLGRLNALPGGGGFVLPTEAQWEYACRAGSAAVYCFGDDPGQGDRPRALERFAWTKRNGGGQLQRVAQLQPNAWGLYDMHGLVYETMRDARRAYGPGEISDPVGPVTGAEAVARGGFWGRFPVDPRSAVQEHFRCASRQHAEKSHRVSFRIAREVP